MEGDYANDEQRVSERSMAGCLNKSRLGSRKKNLMLVREDNKEEGGVLPIPNNKGSFFLVSFTSTPGWWHD